VIAYNLYSVTERDGKLYVQTHPGGMDREQALNLAAWIVIYCKLLPGAFWLEDVISEINKR
jgi:hypothetical protein